MLIFEKQDTALTDSDLACKCRLARKETSETQYWLDLCLETELITFEHAGSLAQEAEELATILAAVVRGPQSYMDSKK